MFVTYINPAERILIKMIRKARSVLMEKLKGNLGNKNSIKKRMKQSVKVKKEFAVSFSSCSSAWCIRYLFQRPSMKRIGIILHRPNINGLEQSSVICQYRV
jgi:hypothetical protein